MFSCYEALIASGNLCCQAKASVVLKSLDVITRGRKLIIITIIH